MEEEDLPAARLRALAREKLDGVAAAAALHELDRCPRLLAPGEAPLTMALAMSGRRGRIVVATDRRLMLVETGVRPDHGRLESVPWERVRAVDGAGLGFRVQTDEGVLELGLVEPAERAGEIADLFRARSGVEVGSTRAELRELAERKLGAGPARRLAPALGGLHDALEPGEWVRTLASAKRHKRGLLALTDRRLAFSWRTGLFGTRALVESWPVALMTSVSEHGGGLRVGLQHGQERFAGVEPADRAWEIAVTIRGRLDRGQGARPVSGPRSTGPGAPSPRRR